MDVAQTAARLDVSPATLKGWLAEDQDRDPEKRKFDFHRWRGRRRKWTEEGFRKLELAIHEESQTGVLSKWRTREKTKAESPPDPDAEAALAEVLGTKHTRTY
ncbi:hypothetical protein SAMN05444050_4243 [Afipia sp. GAS231]|nr:hypothetical protein SAMN05444050_4243 [Afipia sp. GAS231]